MQHRASRLPAIVLAVFTAACGNDVASNSGFASSDSAGITLAVNAEPAWRDGRGWSVDSAASWTVGADQGDSTQLLFNVTAARRLPDGTMVIVNGGTSEVRWYDSAARLVRSVGGEGGGPGEFSRYGPGGMCMLPQGELLVSDPMQKRAAVFTSSGEFVRTVTLTGGDEYLSIDGCFSDGSLLAWHSISSPERVPGTIVRSSFAWQRVDADGSNVRELATVPGAQQYLLDQGGGVATYHTIPFTVRPTAAATGDAIYVAPGDAPVLQRRGLDGSMRMIVRWTPASRVQTADAYGRYRAHTLDAIENPARRAGWVKFFDAGIAYPAEGAVVQGLLVDDGGNVWAERYRLPWDTDATWDVFEPTGRWLGGVAMPAGLKPLHITADAVVGLTRDEMDVEHVSVHALRRD